MWLRWWKPCTATRARNAAPEPPDHAAAAQPPGCCRGRRAPGLRHRRQAGLRKGRATLFLFGIAVMSRPGPRSRLGARHASGTGHQALAGAGALPVPQPHTPSTTVARCSRPGLGPPAATPRHDIPPNPSRSRSAARRTPPARERHGADMARLRTEPPARWPPCRLSRPFRPCHARWLWHPSGGPKPLPSRPANGTACRPQGLARPSVMHKPGAADKASAPTGAPAKCFVTIPWQ